MSFGVGVWPTNCCIPVYYYYYWVNWMYTLCTHYYLFRRCGIKKSIEACHVNVKMTITQIKITKICNDVVDAHIQNKQKFSCLPNRIGCVCCSFGRESTKMRRTQFSDWLSQISVSITMLLTNYESWNIKKGHRLHTHISFNSLTLARTHMYKIINIKRSMPEITKRKRNVLLT